MYFYTVYPLWKITSTLLCKVKILSCTSGHTQISSVATGVFPLTADAI